jgi:hypothetical protein
MTRRLRTRTRQIKIVTKPDYPIIFASNRKAKIVSPQKKIEITTEPLFKD